MTRSKYLPWALLVMGITAWSFAKPDESVVYDLCVGSRSGSAGPQDGVGLVIECEFAFLDGERHRVEKKTWRTNCDPEQNIQDLGSLPPLGPYSYVLSLEDAVFVLLGDLDQCSITIQEYSRPAFCLEHEWTFDMDVPESSFREYCASFTCVDDDVGPAELPKPGQCLGLLTIEDQRAFVLFHHTVVALDLSEGTVAWDKDFLDVDASGGLVLGSVVD